MSSTHHTAHAQGEAAALRAALRLSLAALEKAIDDGCAIEAHDRMTIDGDTWTFGGICALAHDALTGGHKPVQATALADFSGWLAGNQQRALDGMHTTTGEAFARHCEAFGTMATAIRAVLQFEREDASATAASNDATDGRA